MDETPNRENLSGGKRPRVTPWITRDRIPKAVGEAATRQAAAEGAAVIQHVLAAPLRGLLQLAHPPGPAIGERRTGLLGPDHERTLSAAIAERERARAQLLATVFALPGLILGRRRVSAPGSVAPGSAMQRPAATEGTSIPSPAIDRSGETP